MPRKKKREMEFYDKKTGNWIKVSSEKFSEKIIRIYDYMQAEMQILAKIEEMRMKKDDE